ncbi:glyoxalase-like domain-containing protein [Purpureocillium lavendulum]|uniref:Glyoxalase-like domain-containing protein n=1 Tax=Purpureocillium lavendulum TaxID=1247861 RepID=A0AB34FGC6_9HYPO|nr:glyoxalase-like domain-containing protein [Purpureocillium lavendulum]
MAKFFFLALLAAPILAQGTCKDGITYCSETLISKQGYRSEDLPVAAEKGKKVASEKTLYVCRGKAIEAYEPSTMRGLYNIAVMAFSLGVIAFLLAAPAHAAPLSARTPGKAGSKPIAPNPSKPPKAGTWNSPGHQSSTVGGALSGWAKPARPPTSNSGNKASPGWAKSGGPSLPGVPSSSGGWAKNDNKGWAKNDNKGWAQKGAQKAAAVAVEVKQSNYLPGSHDVAGFEQVFKYSTPPPPSSATAPTTTTTLPPIGTLSAITLVSEDPPASQAFYERVLGATPVFRDADCAVVRVPGVAPPMLLNLLRPAAAAELFGGGAPSESSESTLHGPSSSSVREKPSSSSQEKLSSPPSVVVSHYHRAQMTLTTTDLDAAVAALRGRGLARFLTGPETKPWGVRTVTFEDPAGHSWEVAQPVVGAETGGAPEGSKLAATEAKANDVEEAQ